MPPKVPSSVPVWEYLLTTPAPVLTTITSPVVGWTISPRLSATGTGNRATDWAEVAPTLKMFTRPPLLSSTNSRPSGAKSSPRGVFSPFGPVPWKPNS